VGEERDSTTVRAGAEHAEVRLDQLVEEPGAEEKPCREVCRG
jgi:hypothetical protein